MASYLAGPESEGLSGEEQQQGETKAFIHREQLHSDLDLGVSLHSLFLSTDNNNLHSTAQPAIKRKDAASGIINGAAILANFGSR